MNAYARITPALNGLANDPRIRQYDVLKYEHTALRFQLKMKIEFVDQSLLFTNEYLGNAIREYAFHWQRTDDSWLIRWNNAPHFPLIESFPHHKHDYRQGTEIVTESSDITLPEVLAYIGQNVTLSPP